jgi:hypothetical protein
MTSRRRRPQHRRGEPECQHRGRKQTAWLAAKAWASTAGAYSVDLSPTEDAGPSDDEHPAVDNLGPAAVAASAAAKRAKTSVVTAPAGDITEGCEDVDKMKAYDLGSPAV